MKQKQSVASALIILAAGLLITVVASSIHRYINMPDFVTGTLVGVGIGIELLGFIKLVKLKQLKKANLPS